jgi:ubiquinone/menaquinone biosynthesis C-methylase UbiE
LSDIEKGVKINTNEIDLILIVNVLFQSDRSDLILKEAERILKNEGKLVIIDWKGDNPMGLKKELIDFDDIKKRLIGSFNLEKEFDAGRYHRGLIFIKKINNEKK